MLTLLDKSVEDFYKEGIKCTLEHVTLLNPGDYTALSYSWGDTRNKVPILINGVKVKVTVNLSAGLKKLWLRGYRRVWIDALCT